MPWISRRAQAETAAAMTRLRDRCRDLETELAEQGRANGRLANRTAKAEAAVDSTTAVIRTAHRQLREENARLRAVVDRQATTIRGLNSQLDNALGYTAEEIAMLDAGTVAKR